MKNVNLFGCTTAEKLIKLQEAYDSLIDSLFGTATPKGNYSVDTVYSFGDMVMNDGSSYVYINQASAQGIPLTNISYWFTIAQKGEKGDTGATGTDGKGITTVETGVDYEQGGYTNTPITFYTGEIPLPVKIIKAKNGAAGTGMKFKYWHRISLNYSGTDVVAIWIDFFDNVPYYNLTPSNVVFDFILPDDSPLGVMATGFYRDSVAGKLLPIVAIKKSGALRQVICYDPSTPASPGMLPSYITKTITQNPMNAGDYPLQISD